VRVFSQIRCLGLAAALGLAATPAIAQDWSVGATYGAVNDVERGLHLGDFHPHDVSAWVDCRLEPHVLLRASYVSIRTTGDNAGHSESVVNGEPPAPLPGLHVGIKAVTLGVSYTVSEGFYTSGFFAGIGGYSIHPEATPPELTPFADPKETVFGFHAGVDADFRIVKHVSAVGRLTVHGILSSSKRWLLAASAGLAIHL
jgi:hypothetical protein